MRYLVTGGCGFIGRRLTAMLRDRGDEVAVADIRDPEYPVDVADYEACRRLFKCKRGLPVFYDAVFHLAAISDIHACRRHPALCLRNNYLATAHIGCLCDRPMIFASSAAVYGGNGMYAESKRYGEQHARTSLRLFNVYGPGNDKGVIWHWLNDKTPTIYGDGEQVRDYIHVDDVCRAFIAAVANGGHVLDVGTGCGTTLNELARMMGVRPVYMPAVKGDEMASVARGIGDWDPTVWQPEITLEKGLDMMRKGMQ